MRQARARSLLVALAVLVAASDPATAQIVRGPQGDAAPFRGRGGPGLFMVPGLLGLMPRPRMGPPPATVDVPEEPDMEPLRQRRVVRAARRAPPATPPRSARAPRVVRAAVARDPAGIVPREVLVTLRPGATPDAVLRLARRERLDLVDTQDFTLVPVTVDRFRLRGRRTVAAAVRALQAEPLVAAAQPSHVFVLADDAKPAGLAAAQYAIARLHLVDAHRTAVGRDVPVAVIDSLADAAHPALAGAVAESVDLIGGSPSTPHAHGTAIVGLVAARAVLDSAAPGARILAIRAFAPEGDGAAAAASGTTMPLLRALDWAAAHGARIVNMSFAGPPDALLARFLAAGAARGAIYVAAAGNAGAASPPLFPADDPNVLGVTATDAQDRLLASATRGPHVGIAAPGGDIMVAVPGGGYGYASGTSMAAAEVSGIVALLVQKVPDLTLPALRAALAQSAQPFAKDGVGGVSAGPGVADAAGALALAGTLAVRP